MQPAQSQATHASFTTTATPRSRSRSPPGDSAPVGHASTHLMQKSQHPSANDSMGVPYATRLSASGTGVTMP